MLRSSPHIPLGTPRPADPEMEEGVRWPRCLRGRTDGGQASRLSGGETGKAVLLGQEGDGSAVLGEAQLGYGGAEWGLLVGAWWLPGGITQDLLLVKRRKVVEDGEQLRVDGRSAWKATDGHFALGS